MWSSWLLLLSSVFSAGTGWCVALKYTDQSINQLVLMHPRFNMIKQSSSCPSSSDLKQTFAGENVLFSSLSVLHCCMSAEGKWWSTTFAGEMIFGESGVKAHGTAHKPIIWTGGEDALCSSLTHTDWRTDDIHWYTPGTQRLHSPLHQTTSRYSAPPSLGDSKVSRSQSISSFWGQPPWHYGAPWCLRPAAETDEKEQEKKSTKKKITWAGEGQRSVGQGDGRPCGEPPLAIELRTKE